MNNQAFSKIWIIVIVVGILAGGILAWQYFGVPKEEVKVPEEKAPEEIEDETADWKIYRNERFGFEIKYPKDWESEITSELPPEVPPLDIPLFVKFEIKFGLEKTPEDRFISLLIRTVSPEELQCIQTTDYFSKKFLGKVNINNIEFCKIEYESKREYAIIYLAVKNGDGYEISLSNKGFYMNEYPEVFFLSKKEMEKRLPVFNQILSTFRFLE